MKKTLLIFVGLVSIGLSACRKENTFDGPSINEINSKFAILESFKVNKATADFETGNAIFTARFNKIVSWKITIKGSISKATKIISGESKVLDASNASWNGSITLFPLFKPENCTATLLIASENDSASTTISISKTKLLPSGARMIANFENGFDPNWTKFFQSGASMECEIRTDSFAPEGTKYLNMGGTIGWNDWLVGFVDFNAKAYQSNVTFPLSNNPENEYFNVLIYGDQDPKLNMTKALFQFKEDENSDGVFNVNKEDQYDYIIDVTWSGWRLVSVKYADLATLVNGTPAIPNGNKSHNPDKISMISFLQLAKPQSGPSRCKIDLVSFTQNKALDL
jgi:hypothetical protein